MAKPLASPERILPTRMTLHIPADTPIRFSVLDFPYQNAYNTFMSRLDAIYKHNNQGKRLPFALKPPTRQLNDGLLTLARGLVQGFEYTNGKWRMVTLTHCDAAGHPEDFLSIGNLQNLIRAWLERWSEQSELQSLLNGDGKAAWDELMTAVNDAPETEWQHGINPISLAENLKRENGLAYIALPALLTGLLHQKKMTVQGEKQMEHLRWGRANSSGKNGLHLVTQPIPFSDDFFAYRLDFSVQTQTGYPGFWIFAHLSIQRYITETYRGGDKGRNISVLVGFNRESFNTRWDDDTTLLRLGVKRYGDNKAAWESGVADLLQGFGSPLPDPSQILDSPYLYGNYEGKTDWNDDEYYVVYAEGRKFGEERGRKHEVMTGTTFRNRSLIMAGVLSLLEGWLEVSPPLEFDIQNPNNTFALRDYEYMAKENTLSAQKQASWRAALETSLKNGKHEGVHIVVAYRSETFRDYAEKQICEALMEVDTGDNPLATVTFEPVSPLLSAPLDSCGLDSDLWWKPADKKPANFTAQFNEQMRRSYTPKLDDWRRFLRGIQWQPNARRLILIDSPKIDQIPPLQRIKSAVRDACVREGVSSQFLIGNFDSVEKLSGEMKGRLQNAVLDLLLRQQGILYAPPSEIYERAARLDPETAHQLDVITFCRVARNKPKINYILAARLRATGEVDVLLPYDNAEWLTYDVATHRVGKIFSDSRVKYQRDDNNSYPLYFDNTAMVRFVERVLTEQLEHPTIAVIEAERWRDSRGDDEEKHCWTQLQNGNLAKNQDVLLFEAFNCTYHRDAPKLDALLAVVRLRMDDETPQYITAETWTDEDPMRDIGHLTGYVDPCVGSPMHYMSIAGLSDGQKDQRAKAAQEALKVDARNWKGNNIAYKHPQMVELVPFFVYPRYDSDEGKRQLCRCVHFLRNSPGFTMSDILLPYPMHIGESLIEDMLCLVGVEE